jgi:hypothetical protein
LQKTAINGSLFGLTGSDTQEVDLMPRQIQLLLFLLLIPMIGIGVSAYVEHNINTTLQAVALAEAPDATVQDVSFFTLNFICTILPGEAAELCTLR